MFSEDLQLPERGVLLHVGPHKTGTTSIQGALTLARPAMAKLGVIYPGKGRQAQMAALALTGGRGMRGDREARPADWSRLVAEVQAAAEQRVIVSSEFFDEATDEVARRVVKDLGGDRVHVVVTLRPLAKIMPSAWQQYVRNGVRRSYDQWLDGMLNVPPYDRPTPSFWRRHHHDALIERWVSIVGPERVAVVVLDESDPSSLMRTFERFVALPEGFLKPETGWSNRSLTAAETELIRSINIAFVRRKWSPEIYNDVVRLGLIKQIQRRRPERDEPGIATPTWAIERANEIAAQAAERIRATGAHIVGDLAWLSAVTPKDVDPNPAPLPNEAAKAAVIGTLIGSGVVPSKSASGKNVAVANRRQVRLRRSVLEGMTDRELVGELRRRMRARLRRRGAPTEDPA